MIETISNISGICLFLVFTALIAVLYQFVLRYWFYFSDRNVKFIRGAPLLGSAYKSIIGIEPVAVSYRRCYDRFPTEKFCGTYKFGGRPSYLIRSADLVKQILVSDSDYFDNKSDLCAYTFKTPAFLGVHTMYPLIVKSSNEFIQAIMETNKIAKMFDSYDLFMRYANDITAMATFGLELNSVRETDNDLLKASRLLSEFQYVESLKFLISSSNPSISKFLKNNDTTCTEILREVAKNTLDAGKNPDSVVNNLLNLFKKARSNDMNFDESVDKINVGFAATQKPSNALRHNEIQNFTDQDIIEQCVQFFVGNMNIIAKTACFMFHELSVNPDIQNKLFEEINGMKAQLNGSPLTYEMIPLMPYLDMVVSETLRRWPVFPFFERICNRPYTLMNSNDTKVELQIGDSVTIPTYGLHMDEKYFVQPIKFDPERFNDENRRLIRAGTYLPFGGNYVGSQFILMAIKTLTFHLLSEFYVDKSYQTQDPLKLKALPLQMNAENGFSIELRRRHPDRTPYKSQVFS